MKEFLNFELSKKIISKGFKIKYPFAMYGSDGYFYPLYSSDEFYYDLKDFDKEDIIAPTIQQVLSWLRKEKRIVLNIDIFKYGYTWEVFENVNYYNGSFVLGEFTDSLENFNTYEEAVLNGIEYIIDNLI